MAVFLPREGLPANTTFNDEEDFVDYCYDHFGDTALFLNCADFLSQNYIHIGPDVCQCDFCKREPGSNDCLHRPLYIVSYHDGSAVPSVTCLTHMKTLCCLSCKQECEGCEPPDPFSIKEDYHCIATRLQGETQSYMNWICMRHPFEYGRCPDCAEQGVFCYYAIQCINNYCGGFYFSVDDTLEITRKSGMGRPYEVKEAHLSGLLLHLLLGKQMLSCLFHSLCTPAKSVADMIQVLNHPRKLDEDTRRIINEELCDWSPNCVQFLRDKLLQLVDKFEKQEPLQKKIKRLKAGMKKKTDDVDRLTAQLLEAQKELVAQRKELERLTEQIAELKTVDSEIPGLRAEITELSHEKKQLALEAAVEREMSGKYHDQFLQTKQALEQTRKELRECQERMKKERTLREQMAGQKSAIEKNYNKLQKRLADSERETQRRIKQATDPLTRKILELQKTQRPTVVSPPPRLRPVTPVQYSSEYSSEPMTLSDFIRKGGM